MKEIAVVYKNVDPGNVGRILVRIPQSGSGFTSPFYAYPCTPFAGPEFGFMILPEIGDQVWVEKTADGTWVYSGFFWSQANQPPSEASAKRRILKTPAGHKLLFDDEGNIELEHSGGAKIVLKPDGTIEINGNGGNAVRFAELKSGFDQLKNEFNSHTHPETSVNTGPPSVPSLASIDGAEVDEVKLP